MSVDSASTTPERIGLDELVDKTITKQADCYKVKKDIQKVLLNFSSFKKGLKINVGDPSYKLRYRYALDFWKEKTRNGEIENKKQADDKLEELKSELNDKFCVHQDINDGQEVVLDKFFSQETPIKQRPAQRKHNYTSDINVTDKMVCYVTSKCESKFYVKPMNVSEAEIEIDRAEFDLINYKVISPGDEVQIIHSDGENQKKVITKYVLCTLCAILKY